MSRRPQVLLEDAKMRELRRLARHGNVTVAEWVRGALCAARLLIERAIAAGERLVSDAEVLQEILDRYVAIARRDAIHVALLERRGVADILSFDSGFDQVPGIRRVSA